MVEDIRHTELTVVRVESQTDDLRRNSCKLYDYRGGNNVSSGLEAEVFVNVSMVLFSTTFIAKYFSMIC